MREMTQAEINTTLFEYGDWIVQLFKIAGVLLFYSFIFLLGCLIGRWDTK